MKRAAPKRKPRICGKFKMGEYNMLKCFRAADHEGPCGFSVAGPLTLSGGKGKGSARKK